MCEAGIQQEGTWDTWSFTQFLVAGSFPTPPCGCLLHAEFPPADLRHVGKLVGNATDFGEGFPGKHNSLGDGTLCTSHGCAASQAPQHTRGSSHFPFLALCFGPGEEMKSSHFLFRGKEQAGIACLKPTTSISNVAKAICRAWNETCTSLPIYPSFLYLSLSSESKTQVCESQAD